MNNPFGPRKMPISVVGIGLLIILAIMGIGFSQIIMHEIENEVYYLRPHASDQTTLRKSKLDIPKPPPWTINYENIRPNPQPITQGKTALLELVPTLPIPINDAQKVVKDMRVWFLQRVFKVFYHHGRFYALIGIDVVQEPGMYTVEILKNGQQLWPINSIQIKIHKGKFRLRSWRRIKRGKPLSEENYKRIKLEKAKKENSIKEALNSERDDVPFQLIDCIFPLHARVLRITGRFGDKRIYYLTNPKERYVKLHPAVDFWTPIPIPIKTIADGTVIDTDYYHFDGNYIAIHHNYGVITQYIHLSEINVEVGQRVTRGDRIGTSGNTGYTTNPNLDFRVTINRTRVDPLQFIELMNSLSLQKQKPPLQSKNLLTVETKTKNENSLSAQ